MNRRVWLELLIDKYNKKKKKRIRKLSIEFWQPRKSERESGFSFFLFFYYKRREKDDFEEKIVDIRAVQSFHFKV